MKNIVCPISAERVQEHVPRITALFVISLLTLYLFTGFVPILVFMAADFIIRGAGYSQFSILHQGTVAFSNGFHLKSDKIDKAPKLFAARLGAVMMIAAFILDVASFNVGATAIAAIVVFFATLESALNFCVGCYVYSLVVLPIYQKRK